MLALALDRIDEALRSAVLRLGLRGLFILGTAIGGVCGWCVCYLWSVQ